MVAVASASRASRPLGIISLRENNRVAKGRLERCAPGPFVSSYLLAYLWKQRRVCIDITDAAHNFCLPSEMDSNSSRCTGYVCATRLSDWWSFLFERKLSKMEIGYRGKEDCLGVFRNWWVKVESLLEVISWEEESNVIPSKNSKQL